MSLDALFDSTEANEDGQAYVPDVGLLSDTHLTRALDRLHANRGFQYLPSASLTVNVPASRAPDGAVLAGSTLGSLSFFRGGRIQWEAGDGSSGQQDWRVPHLYAGRDVALRLWRLLLAGQVDEVARAGWVVAQTRLCPICGFDLSDRVWPQWRPEGRGEDPLPPLDVPRYSACGGCRTTFGVDWVGASFAEMRRFWLERDCPWWDTGIPPQPSIDVATRIAFERLERDLMRTPTDMPLSSESQSG